MQDNHVGRTCPYCQAVIKPGQEVVVCSQCGVVHHKECCEANGGCTTLSCAGATLPLTGARPSPARKPPSSASGLPRPAPRRSRKLGCFLALLLLLTASGGYYLGWYYSELPFPFETVAGWHLLSRHEYEDLKQVRSWFRSHTNGSEPVYAMGLPILPEHGREVFYAQTGSEETASDWCRGHPNGLVVVRYHQSWGWPGDWPQTGSASLSVLARVDLMCGSQATVMQASRATYNAVTSPEDAPAEHHRPHASQSDPSHPLHVFQAFLDAIETRDYVALDELTHPPRPGVIAHVGLGNTTTWELSPGCWSGLLSSDSKIGGGFAMKDLPVALPIAEIKRASLEGHMAEVETSIITICLREYEGSWYLAELVWSNDE